MEKNLNGLKGDYQFSIMIHGIMTPIVALKTGGYFLNEILQRIATLPDDTSMGDIATSVAPPIFIGIAAVGCIFGYGIRKLHYYQKSYKNAKEELLDEVTNIALRDETVELDISVTQKNPKAEHSVATTVKDIDKGTKKSKWQREVYEKLANATNANDGETESDITFTTYDNSDSAKANEIYQLIDKNPGLDKVLRKEQKDIEKNKETFETLEDRDLYNRIIGQVLIQRTKKKGSK